MYINSSDVTNRAAPDTSTVTQYLIYLSIHNWLRLWVWVGWWEYTHMLSVLRTINLQINSIYVSPNTTMAQ